MVFDGWAAEDFEVFSVPGFEPRMELIRARIQPKLDALGRELIPLLKAETGTEWFHHVAKHMRRTVNPPSDTWVALNRVKKGYKATVHFDVGLSALGANACVVVKPECLERDVFADSLERNAKTLTKRYRSTPDLYLGDVPNAERGDLLPVAQVDPEEWQRRAESLRRRKQFEFEAGFRWEPDAIAALSGEEFLRRVFEGLRELLPLYQGGVERDFRLVLPRTAKP